MQYDLENLYSEIRKLQKSEGLRIKNSEIRSNGLLNSEMVDTVLNRTADNADSN